MAQTYESARDVGRAPYARRYHRRPDELILHFADGVDIDAFFADPGCPVTPVTFAENAPRFASLFATGRRWVAAVEGDGDLRGLARDLEAGPDIDMATPVFEPRGDLDFAATPLPGEFLVLADDGRLDEVAAVLADLELHLVPGVGEHLPGGHALFRLAPDRLRDDGFTALGDVVAAHPAIRGVEHDWMQIQTFQAFPKDPPSEWRAKVVEQPNLERIGMRAAWARTGGGPGAPIVVVDSGFESDHPDLPLHHDTEYWLDVEKLWRTGSLVASNSTDPSDVFHGMQVAGIAGARTDNDVIGVAGVACGCGIVPVRVGGAPTAAQIAAGIGWSRRVAALSGGGIRVVNLSLTTAPTIAVIDAVEAAVADDLVLCAASGNIWVGADGGRTVGFPAVHDGVIGVGACDERGDARAVLTPPGAWQSRYGEGLDVVAPGVDLWTTDDRAPKAGFNLDGRLDDMYGTPKPTGDANGEYFARFGGTSGATPHVAGLASLILAQVPGMSAARLRHVISATCEQIGGLPYGARPRWSGAPAWTPECGHGLIQAAAALDDGHPSRTEALPIVAPRPDRTGTVPYEGRLGPGGGGVVRIYGDLALQTWIEVLAADIVDMEPLATGFLGDRVYVRRGAPVRRVVTRPMRAGR